LESHWMHEEHAKLICSSGLFNRLRSCAFFPSELPHHGQLH
jgi:hypothetical protein